MGRCPRPPLPPRAADPAPSVARALPWGHTSLPCPAPPARLAEALGSVPWPDHSCVSHRRRCCLILCLAPLHLWAWGNRGTGWHRTCPQAALPSRSATPTLAARWPPAPPSLVLEREPAAFQALGKALAWFPRASWCCWGRILSRGRCARAGAGTGAPHRSGSLPR